MCFYMTQERQTCSGDRDLVWEVTKCWSLLKSLLSSSSWLHCWNPVYNVETSILPWIFPLWKPSNRMISHASGSWDENNDLLTLLSFFSLPSFSFLFLPLLSSLHLLPLFRSPASSYVGCILSHCYHPPFICTREYRLISCQSCKGRRQIHFHSSSISTWNPLE